MAKRNKNRDSQTQFSQEGAVLEDQHEELLFEPSPNSENNSFFKSRKVLVVSITGFILLLLMVLIGIIILAKNTATQIANPNPADESVIIEQNASPLQSELNQLKLRLEQADPSKRELPFPQIELEINLEED